MRDTPHRRESPGRRVFIIEGTTFTLPPAAALRKAYPPAIDQRRKSRLPVAQLMVAAELQSGCVVSPQIDPMYGENDASEAAQARRIALELPENSIILAGTDFGICSVAHHCCAAGHDIIFRLTHTRFKALLRDAERIDGGPNHQSYQLQWTPNDKDRKTNPDLPKDAAVEVVLHEVKRCDGDTLYLVGTLKLEAEMAALLYERRFENEFDIRDLKVTMDEADIQVASVDLVMKDLHTSIAAYNLIAQFRRQAAEVAAVAPRKLSFTGIYLSFRYGLLIQPPCGFEQWTERYEAALLNGASHKHPNRSRSRSSPK